MQYDYRGVYKRQEIDVGLRQHMVRVYQLMSLALIVTGVTAFALVSSHTLLVALSRMFWLVVLAPLGFSIAISSGLSRFSLNALQMLYLAFAISMGLSISFICAVYTGESVARTFFVSASMFGAMSIYGYTTTKDLTSFGSFLIMGVFGILIAALVNMFMQSSVFQFFISFVSVLVFTGLTAYDTQKIKEIYFESDSDDVLWRKAIYGALVLYTDFINIFISLLRLTGTRRD